MSKKFYSNGKLLITGEYLVLDGAKAFAVPTKMGQDLVVTENFSIDTLYWKSFDSNQSIWFESTFKISEIITKSLPIKEETVATVLQKILFEAHQLNPTVLPHKGFNIETHLGFPRFWGLGTSSTLINNIAQWFEINAFELLKNTFGGSGYDIACAQNDTAITYQLTNEKPMVEKVSFNPVFKKNIYFLYLNKKQNSRAAIATYYSKQQNIEPIKAKINAITNELIQVNNSARLEYLIQKHETLMSDVLEMDTVQELFFPDFNGTIKSLGAWGGDFVLVVSDSNPTKYFEEKGFTTLLHYHEMLL